MSIITASNTSLLINASVAISIEDNGVYPSAIVRCKSQGNHNGTMQPYNGNDTRIFQPVAKLHFHCLLQFHDVVRRQVFHQKTSATSKSQARTFQGTDHPAAILQWEGIFLQPLNRFDPLKIICNTK